MNEQLIKQLIADASNDKIGMRMRAVVDAVVSAAPKRGVHAISAGRPAKPVENSTPDTITTLQVSSLAPIKNKRRRAIGFAN